MDNYQEQMIGFGGPGRPVEPVLKPGEYVIFPDYDAAVTARGYDKEYKNLAERYQLLGMTPRQYMYFRTVYRFQCGPGMPWASLEAIAKAMYRSYFTVYEIRRELVDAGFLIMRGTYHPDQGHEVYLHDFTPLFQMIQALDDKDLYREAIGIDYALRHERMAVNRYAARSRGRKAQSTEPAEQAPSPQGRLELVRYREQFRQRLLAHAQAYYTSNSLHDAESLGESLGDWQGDTRAESQGNIDLTVIYNNNINNQEIDSSNLSKGHSHENFFRNEDAYPTPETPLTQEYNDEASFSTGASSLSEEQITQDTTNSEYVLQEIAAEAGEQAQASERYMKASRQLAQEHAVRDQQRPTLDKSLVGFVQDFSAQFHDAAPKSSITRVAALAQMASQVGMSKPDFVEAMYEARRRTLGAYVKKRTDDGKHTNRMPYFLECLEYLVYYSKEYQQYQHWQAPPHPFSANGQQV